MQKISFRVSPNAALEVRRVGQARTPVIVIDNFAENIEDIINHACEAAEFGPATTSIYPGIRAKLPKSYTREVLRNLYRLFFSIYSVPTNLGMKAVNAAFSLIATPERELEPNQGRPHFDSDHPYFMAVLHYLNQGNFCDTGLFRHRSTGWERITNDNFEAYIQALKDQEKANGPPTSAYVKGSNEHYELYHRIEYRPNRLVAYPGGLLHSGLVDPAVDINPDPRTGRLTANIFVDFFPLEARD
jgi:hypothetical protein